MKIITEKIGRFPKKHKHKKKTKHIQWRKVKKKSKPLCQIIQEEEKRK